VGAHRPGFWIAVVAAELLALRPVLFDSEAPIQWLDVVVTLVAGSFAASGLIACAGGRTAARQLDASVKPASLARR